MTIAHHIELGVAMSVLEMQSHAGPTARWTEVCPADHRGQEPRAVTQRTGSGAARIDPTPRRSAVRPQDRRPAALTSVAPGRRVLVRPASTVDVRACHVEAPAATGVVDDVPTWALVACGVAFGVLMLLALAFLGGPAYA